VQVEAQEDLEAVEGLVALPAAAGELEKVAVEAVRHYIL
jgi:hypothetical protein